MCFVSTLLTRTIRFCLRADGSLDADAPADNTYAAWPPMRGLGRYYELHVTCGGPVQQPTGYMLNIKQIDQAVRDAALPLIAEAAMADAPQLGPLLKRVARALGAALSVEVARVGLQLAPTVWIALETFAMDTVLIAQQYDFSAAHRLHVPSLSEQENRAVFGKCNNPSGHGHNYRLQVTIAAPVGQTPFDIGRLDKLVNEQIIERYDHKHLNTDTEDFADLNPSAENIARTIYHRLAEEVGQIDAALREVKVWETEKTVCAYRGE